MDITFIIMEKFCACREHNTLTIDSLFPLIKYNNCTIALYVCWIYEYVCRLWRLTILLFIVLFVTLAIFNHTFFLAFLVPHFDWWLEWLVIIHTIQLPNNKMLVTHLQNSGIVSKSLKTVCKVEFQEHLKIARWVF